MTDATTLVTYDHHQTRRDWLTIQNPAIELANAIAGTDFVPVAFRNNPAAIAAAILYGDEVGIGPMQSLAKIAVINGRPTLAAEAQRALILQAGHDLWVEESTPTRCTVCGRRRGSDQTSRITWTMDDAKRANLAGKPPWRLYPRQMLLARASSDLARAIFPDAIGGLAATEELDDGAVVDVGTEAAAAAPTARRRRASVTATAPPDDAQTPPLPDPAEPDPTPEPPTPEPPAPQAPEPEPMMISDGQRRKIQAMFREVGISDRQQRLDYCSLQTGRTIGSANDLTWHEASQLIDQMEAAKTEAFVDAHQSLVAGDAVPDYPPEYVTAEQREHLFNVRQEAGISDLRLREILLEQTGQQLTAQIPVAKWDDVLAAIALEAAPFE